MSFASCHKSLIEMSIVNDCSSRHLSKVIFYLFSKDTIFNMKKDQ